VKASKQARKSSRNERHESKQAVKASPKERSAPEPEQLNDFTLKDLFLFYFIGRLDDLKVD